ncbi:4-hydroxybenzoate octaprenyltransferase [Petrachloros mirabilis]
MSGILTSPPQSSTLSWSLIGRLIRFQNPTGTWLLLFPTMWALVLAARGLPPWDLVIIFSLGSFLMRSAGVVLNDLADRSFDRQVTRTKQRPLASGELTTGQAVAVLTVLLMLSGLLVSHLNLLTICLSPIAVLLAMLYPFAKRYIHIPQAILGIAFGWGTIMAWTALRDSLDTTGWLVFVATVCWAIGYDTIYAIQDLEDDRRIGVKSSALFFGSSVWVAVAVSLTAMLCILGIAGASSGIGWLFYGILAVVGLFCFKQVVILKSQQVDTRHAFLMFQQHVWFGTAILAGLLFGFVL